MMQQRSTEQQSAVDLRRRLTNLKTPVHQFNVSSLETVHLTAVKCSIKCSVSTGTCQQFVADDVTISNIFGIVQGSIAIYCK